MLPKTALIVERVLYLLPSRVDCTTRVDHTAT